MRSIILTKKTSRMKIYWEFYKKVNKNFKFLGNTRVNYRMYSPKELQHMLARTGWEVVDMFDDFEHKNKISKGTKTFTVISKPSKRYY